MSKQYSYIPKVREPFNVIRPVLNSQTCCTSRINMFQFTIFKPHHWSGRLGVYNI